MELLFLAARSRIPMVEVPVEWNEIDGSTLHPVKAAIQMARDVFIIRLSYLTGIWSYRADPPARSGLAAAAAPVSTSGASPSSSGGARKRK